MDAKDSGLSSPTSLVLSRYTSQEGYFRVLWLSLTDSAMMSAVSRFRICSFSRDLFSLVKRRRSEVEDLHTPSLQSSIKLFLRKSIGETDQLAAPVCKLGILHSIFSLLSMIMEKEVRHLHGH